MNKKYEVPEVEVINLDVQDVICTSGEDTVLEDDILPVLEDATVW